MIHCLPCLQKSGKAPASYDPMRTLRMFGFGLCWYGPYQYYWYNLLDHLMPLKNTANFLAKASTVPFGPDPAPTHLAAAATAAGLLAVAVAMLQLECQLGPTCCWKAVL